MILFVILFQSVLSQTINYYSNSLSYDSTTTILQGYTHSQGLIGFKTSNSLTYIQNFSNQLEEQGLTLVRSMVFLKVAYAFVMSEQKEYILGITENHTIEGYDIPVITSLNNQESNLFFNERCLFLFKFVADVIITSPADFISFDFIYDTSIQEFTLFICSASKGLLFSTTAITSNIKIAFIRFDPASEVGISSCNGLSKIDETHIILNSKYICSFSTISCKSIGQTVSKPTSGVIVSNIYWNSSFAFNLDTSDIYSYNWLATNEQIIRVFNYKDEGQYLLFVIGGSNQVSIKIRYSLDDTILIFSGILLDSTLDQTNIFYNASQELYLVSTVPSISSLVTLFCIDSSYNSSTNTCIKNSLPGCEWESENKCIQCSSLNYLDLNGKCSQCNSNCQGGCNSETYCFSCLGKFRNNANQCSCISPRVEPYSLTRALQEENPSSHNTNQALVVSHDCVCPIGSVENSENNCDSCQNVYTVNCLSCNSTSCQSCQTGSYLFYGNCIPCVKFDSSCFMCDSSGCLKCNSGYYVNNLQKCSLCGSLRENCSECLKDSCTNCNSGYYLSDQSCVPCPQSCLEGCLDEIVCTACSSQYKNPLLTCQCLEGTIQQENDCVCPINTFWSESLLQCTTCSSTYTQQCKNCNQTSCTSCEESYFISSSLSGQCTSCSTKFENCLTCTENECTLCVSNSYLNTSGICAQCNSQCVNGCTSNQLCVSCSGDYKDPSNFCSCLGNRIENSSTFNCECPTQYYESNLLDIECSLCTSKFGDGCLSCNVLECTKCSDSSFQSSDLVECILCSTKFGEACSSCTSSECLVCEIKVDSQGICACSSTQFYSESDSFCKECSSVYSISCKSCDQEQCLDCGDENASYSEIQKCYCNKGYYQSSNSESQIECFQCSQTFSPECVACTQSSCSFCMNEYKVNPINGNCECPSDSEIIESFCIACSDVYGTHCLRCNSTTCLECDQKERIPSNSCSCRDENAVLLSDKCFQCDLASSYSSNLALNSLFTFTMECNFSQDSQYSGDYSIFLKKSYDLSSVMIVPSQSRLNKQIQIPLSETSKVTIVLPHGTSTISAFFVSTDYPTLSFGIDLEIKVTSLYPSMASLYDSYFSQVNILHFSLSNSLIYISEALEIEQFISESNSDQSMLCNSSIEGGVCLCKESQRYFFDCSGSLTQYNKFQNIMIKYYQFVSNRVEITNSLIQNQFDMIMPIIQSVIDVNHLAKDNSQVSNLLTYLEYQISLINEFSSIPFNYQELVDSLSLSLDEVINSSIASSSQISTALSLLVQIQQSSFLTFDPFYSQQLKLPPPCLQIKSNNFLIYQKLFACVSGTLNITNSVFQVEYSSNGNMRNRLITEDANNEEDVNHQCYVASMDKNQDSEKHYFGVSASIFISNPLYKLYPLPYSQQIYSFFSAEYKEFVKQERILLNQSKLEDSIYQNADRELLRLLSSSSSQTFPISFQVITSNPTNSNYPLNSELFTCIYLNKTAMKWDKCKMHFFVKSSNTLTCQCPSLATYIYDYEGTFQDNQDDIKEKQFQLIIMAVILASVFIGLIILYSLIYKPRYKEDGHQLSSIEKIEESFPNGGVITNQSNQQNNEEKIKQIEFQKFNENTLYKQEDKQSSAFHRNPYVNRQIQRSQYSPRINISNLNNNYQLQHRSNQESRSQNQTASLCLNNQEILGFEEIQNYANSNQIINDIHPHARLLSVQQNRKETFGKRKRFNSNFLNEVYEQNKINQPKSQNCSLNEYLENDKTSKQNSPKNSILENRSFQNENLMVSKAKINSYEDLNNKEIIIQKLRQPQVILNNSSLMILKPTNEEHKAIEQQETMENEDKYHNFNKESQIMMTDNYSEADQLRLNIDDDQKISIASTPYHFLISNSSILHKLEEIKVENMQIAQNDLKESKKKVVESEEEEDDKILFSDESLPIGYKPKPMMQK